MKRITVSWRLTIWYGAILTGIVIGFGACVYGLMSRYLLSRTDFELDEELQELQVEVQLARDEEQLRNQLQTRFYYHLAFDFQVCRLDGSNLFRSERAEQNSARWPVRKLSGTEQPTFRESRFVPKMGLMRLAGRVARGPQLTVFTQAMVSLTPNTVELRTLLLTMLAVSPLAIAAALAGGRFLAWHALAPVDRMAAIAAMITGSRLQARIEIENPNDELGHLARTLNSMMERLEHAMTELRRFTADAAHELRTPLAVLHTEVEVARRAPRTAEEYRKVIDVVWEESQRLNRLADQLLQLSRHDNGMVVLRRDEVPLDALLVDVVDRIRVLADDKGVRLEVGPLREWVVIGDDIQLSRLLFNLLENAVKFTPSGGLVKIQATEHAGHLELTITDTGCGIPAADLPHVCERFYRADKSRNGRTGGSGLGLAISKAIVEAHGGTLSIDSQVNAGTTVRVGLPLTPSV